MENWQDSLLLSAGAALLRSSLLLSAGLVLLRISLLLSACCCNGCLRLNSCYGVFSGDQMVTWIWNGKLLGGKVKRKASGIVMVCSGSHGSDGIVSWRMGSGNDV